MEVCFDDYHHHAIKTVPLQLACSLHCDHVLLEKNSVKATSIDKHVLTLTVSHGDSFIFICSIWCIFPYAKPAQLSSALLYCAGSVSLIATVEHDGAEKDCDSEAVVSMSAPEEGAGAEEDNAVQDMSNLAPEDCANTEEDYDIEYDSHSTPDEDNNADEDNNVDHVSESAPSHEAEGWVLFDWLQSLQCFILSIQH